MRGWWLLCVALAACGDDPPSRTTTACGPETNLYLADIQRKTDAFSISVGGQKLGLAKGENTFYVDVHDPAGHPISDASLTALARMPASGVRSPKNARVEIAEKSIARFEVTRVYLQTTGLWEVTLSIRSPNVPPQDVVFPFCVQE